VNPAGVSALQSLAWGPGGRVLYAGAASAGTASVWRLPFPLLLGHTRDIAAPAAPGPC
jgi:hypothetical protein